ncbi:MAG: LysE family translocator [Desulfocapsa sp.]|nr:MAG: LysE family translocator [Desulfocapsa sp.]
MSIPGLLAFASAMFLLAVSPGPGVFATLARALASGFAHAAVLVLGIVLGDIIFLLLAIYGLSSMAEILGSFFTFVKYGGGVYLIWLGIQIWHTDTDTKNRQLQGVREDSWKKNFLSGLMVTLANPKVIFFYLGFLPTVVNLSNLTNTDVLAISIVVIAVLGTVLLSYAFLATRAGKLLSSKQNQKYLNRCAGGVMVTAGGAILLNP